MHYNIFRAILLLILLCGNNVKAQQTEKNDTVYFDQKWNIINGKDAASYYRTPRILTDSGYRLTDYFMNGSLQMLAYATTVDGNIYTGNSVRYDSSGNKKNEGAFRKGMRSGEWIYYYPHSSQIQYRTHYQNDLLSGKSTYYDTTTNDVLLEGDYTDGFRTGQWKEYYYGQHHVLKRARTFHKGLLDSVVTTYYPDGKIKRLDKFVNGSYRKGRCFDSEGGRTKYTAYYLHPRPVKKSVDKVFQQLFIDTGLGKDTSSRILTFYIDIDSKGWVVNSSIEDTCHDALHKAAEHFIASLPEWGPMVGDGIPVPSKVWFKVDLMHSKFIGVTYYQNNPSLDNFCFCL